MAQNTDQAVGLVESIEGLVTVLHADGAETELALGSPLYLNDQITTGEYAAVSVRFVDKTSFSIGEDSRLIIDEYIYDPTTAKGKVDISVLKGMFVFISGLVADENPQNMTISTPGATIGIRGTEGGGEIGEAGESSYYFNADGIIEIITLIGSVIVDETMEVAVVSPNGTPILATGWTAEQIIETFVSALRVAPLEISQRIINADGNLNVDAREYMERLVQQAPDRDSADGASDDKDDQSESEDQGDADVQKDSGEEEGEESQAALSDGAKVEADSSAVALDISFAEDESQNQEDNPLAQQDLLNNSPENVVGAAASYVLEVDAINVDNTAPVFSSGATASVAENAGIDTIVYNAQANDAGGATDDGITYALSDADAFNINANNGEVTLKAPADFETQSSYALAITATDAAGNAATQTVTVSVTDVNDAPTLIGTPITTVAEDTAYSFIPTGADVDTDTTLTYSIAGKPDWATFNEETGELSGTPTNDDVGTTSGIVISVSDGSDTVSLPAFDLAVSNVNDAPTIIGTPDTTVAEDTAYSFIPTGADVDADTTLTYSIAGKPDWADFNTTTGALTGTPTNADVGSTSGIVISVSDGTLTTPLQTFDLEVTNVNDAPTIIGTPVTTVAEDTAYSFTPTGADVDADTTLTYSIAGKPDWADFNTTTGALTGTPTNADVGTTSGIVISVSDGTLTTPLQAFDLEVSNVNDAPTISGTPATTVAEDSTYSFTPTGADVDVGTTLTYSIAGKPDWADFDTTTGALTGTPTNADVGTTSGIVISVSDGTLTTPLQTFNLAVTNTNDAPSISGTPDTTVAEDTAYSFTPTGADVDTDTTLTYSIAGKPDWADFDTTTGALTGTPTNADVGTTSGIVISVSDGTLTTPLQAFDLEVTNVNDAPTITGEPATSVAQDAEYIFTPTGADVDTDTTLIYSIAGKPDWADFNTTTGALTGTPTNADVGTTSGIVISVSDGTLTTPLQAFDLEVSNVNDAPTITGTPDITVAEDTAYSFIPTGADVDTDTTLTYSIAGKPSWATFSTTTGALTGTPTNADVGTTSGIVISVSDGTLTTPLQTFNLAVTNTNDAPTIIGTPATTVAEDTAYSFTPTGADVDTDTTLTYSIAGKPDWADFDTTTGALTGTPTNADVGTTSGIVISVSDGTLTTPLQTFDLAVTNTNDAPTIIGRPATTVAEDTAYSFTPTGADVDAGAILVYSIANKPSWATFNEATGALTGTPTNADVGTTSGIVITLTSGSDTVSLPAFDLAVSNENDAPTIIGRPATTVAEDTEYSFIPTGADVDVGTTLTYSIANKPSWATFNEATGILTGTPTNADVGTTSGIVITLTSGGDTVSLPAFDLAVSNENDAPTIIGTPDTTVAEDTAYSFIPTGADVDAGAILVYSIANKPSWATFSTTTGALTGTPTNADVGSTSGIVITLTSGGDTVSLPAFNLAVSNENDAPTIIGTPDTTVAEDTAYSFIPTGADVDAGAILVYSIANKPSWATFSTTTGALTGTPTNADVGSTSGIVITLTSSGDTVSLPAFDLAVSNENDAPTIIGTPDTTVAEDTAYSFIPTGADVDAGAILVYSIANKPSWATFSTTTGALTGTPTNADVGSTLGIVISVSDGTLTTPLQTFNLAVTNTNDAPVGLPTITGTATQGATLTADTSGIVDVDGLGSFSYQWQADGRAIRGADEATFVPTQAQVGAAITVTVSYTDDGKTAESLTSVATPAVTDEIPPVFSGDDSARLPRNAAEFVPIYNAQASDNNGAADAGITYSLGEMNTPDFRINPNDGKVSIKTTGSSIKDSYVDLKVTATDAAGNQATKTVPVTVTAADNTVPVFSSAATASVVENTSINTVVYDAQVRDAGQEPDVNIFYGLEGADATAFKIDVGSGEVRLRKTADFETKNSYALEVIALDAAGNKATQAVTVTVIDVEDVVFTFEEHRATDVILHTVSAAEGVAIPVFNFVHSDGEKDTTSEDGNLIFRNGNKGEIFFTQEGSISEVNNHGVLTSNINESPYTVEVTGSAGTVAARTLQFVAKVTESLAPYFVDSFGAPLALPTATAPQFMSSLIGDDSGLHYSKVFSSPVYVADEENGISGYKDSSGKFVYSGNTNTLTRTPNTDLQDSGSSNNWAPSKFTFGEAGSGLIFRFGDSDSDSYVVPDTGTDTNWTVTNPAHKAVGPSTGNIFIDNNNDGTYDEKVNGVGDDLIANLVAGSGRLITTFQKETSATTDDVSALLQSLHFGYLGQKPTKINILANDGDSDNPDADNVIDHTSDYSVAVV